MSKEIREMINKVKSFYQFVNEQVENDRSGLILYHGSDEGKPFSKFNNDQFFTVNDYIACNYAENKGGLVYKVNVDKKYLRNTLELKGNYLRLDGESMKTIEPKQYELEYNLVKKLYGDSALGDWLKRGFYPSPAHVFSGDYKPLINWAKNNGYDSIKFFDESFDTFVRDITYIIFNGNNIKIIDVTEPEC